MLAKLKISFIYKTVNIIVLFLFSLFLIPILLQYWDLELYGSWIAIYAFFNLIKVVEFGHSKYVGNIFNRLVHSDKSIAKATMGAALRINLGVGVIQLSIVCLLYFSGAFSLFFTGINEKEVAIVLLILFLYRMFFGSFRGLVVKMLNPFGLIYIAFQFATIEKIIEFSILVLAAVSGISLIELAILWAIVKSIYSIFVLLRLKYILSDFYPFWKYGSVKLGFDNFRKSLLFAYSNFLTRLWNDGVVLVFAAIVGTSFLPLFSATRTIVNYGHKISDLFLAPVTPEIINQYSKNKKNNILDIFNAYWFVTSLLLIGSFSVSLLFMEDFFRIWTKEKLEFDLVLYSAFIIVMLMQNYGKVLLTFFTGINKTTTVLYSSIFQIIGFFITLFLFKDLGVIAVLLGLLVSSLFVDAIWLPFNTFKLFKLSAKRKATFFLNLIIVFFMSLLLWANYLNAPFWVLTLLLVILGILIYRQYTLVSEKTQKKLLKFLKNQKG